MLDIITKTLSFRKEIGRAVLPIGYFANVIDIGDNKGIAFSTDGVGTKLKIAEMMDIYYTVGMDLVAMNANDILCVGAEPLALVDCLSVQNLHWGRTEEVLRGIHDGAKQANIVVAGGETAVVPDLLRSFDLTGSCIGLVDLNKIIDGSQVEPGDILIGIKSNGLHSNGFTKARSILLDANHNYFKHIPSLGTTLGLELLKPTLIYVPIIMNLLRMVHVKALINITGGGFLNITRINAPVSFVINNLPTCPHIMKYLQMLGRVPNTVMFETFNMGVGFCVIVSKQVLEESLSILNTHGYSALKIGQVVKDENKTIHILPASIVSEGDHFIDV